MKEILKETASLPLFIQSPAAKWKWHLNYLPNTEKVE